MADAFSSRLARFRSNFKQVFQRHQGYDELGQLEQPLVGTEPAGDSYAQQHGVLRPGQTSAAESYNPPVSSSAYADAHGVPPPGSAAGQPAAVPSQADELRQLTELAQEAGAILWEMAAMQDTGDAATDMVSKSEQLQAQLRGMISDYQGVDEGALAAGLEAFELLGNTLEEYKKAKGGSDGASSLPTSTPPLATGTGSSAAPAFRLPPPTGDSNPFSANPFQPAPGQKPKDDAPLISFD
ncbi:hypothetical protein WJX72_003696 [[Myrmecia] bisecta]|uniref:Uncharacterized protein n=1 Tax=[Myrmecia] bisecta TaxID=41462 RepID=A0AAW1PNT5_9CHLO